MISALFVLAAFQEPVTLTLAADTYIDRRSPDSNAGREPLLVGGVDKSILVRFPDLGTKAGAGKRVVSAKLVMGLGRPGEPRLESIGRVLRPWGEGGDNLTNAKAMAGGATWKQALSGREGLAWERDGALGGNDAETVRDTQTSLSNDVFSVTGLETAVQQMVDNPQENYGFRLVFSNAVAFFSMDSLANGPNLVLTLADAPEAAVDLQALVCEPSGTQWAVTVRNAGSQASASQTLSVTAPGRAPVVQRFQSAIAPGQTATFKFDMPQLVGPVEHKRSVVVRAIPTETDANLSDNGIVLYPNGLTLSIPNGDVYAAQSTVQDLNERVFPFSKFGAWPMGCEERLRLVTTSATVTASATDHRSILKALTGLTDSLLKPYATEPPMVAGIKATGFVTEAGQVGLLPDTRDDVLIPRDLPIPDRTSTAGLFGDVPMNQWGMLSRSEVTIINSQIGKPRGLPWDRTPTAGFARVFTPDGAPPTGARVDIYQLINGAAGSQPVFSTQLAADGSVLLEPRNGGAFGKANPFGDLQKDGSNGWLIAVVRMGDATSTTWIPVWQLWDEHARGNEAIAFIELRASLSSGPLDTTQNLALNGLVSDAKGRFPAELNSLVDGKNDTGLSLADEGSNYWIDIDLGRDRQIGQIQLVFDGPAWKQFRISTYKTAQSAEAAQIWFEEANGPLNPDATKTEDGKTVLSYTARSVRSRFVRIVPITKEAVKLVEIRVIPIQS